MRADWVSRSASSNIGLDRLSARGLAESYGGNLAYGHIYWTLTGAGRAYVVENGLLE